MAEVMSRRRVLRGFGAGVVLLGCGGENTVSAGAGAGAGATPSAGAPADPPAAGSAGAAAGTGMSTSASTTAGSGGVSAGAGGRVAAPAGASGAAGTAAGSGGAGAGAGAGAGRGAAAGNTAGTPAPAAGSGGVPMAAKPMFDDAASCMLTTTDIEGPFYIDEAEIPNDASMLRADIRDGHPGVEFRLAFRMLDARMGCKPINNAELYLWHCDADGLYSGFSGQDPTKPYMGPSAPAPSTIERFCRGIQMSDEAGIASFTTIYPGWYAGRPIHIHLMARMKGAMTRYITTQLYFPAAFTLDVHESEPAYMARVANMPAASRNPPAGKPAMPTLMHTPGLVTGTLNVIVNS